MNVYMAALHSNGYRHTNRYEKLNDHEKVIVDNLPYLLESYHYIHKQSFVDAIREKGDKIFLDSGAFSAHTLGIKIDLPTYCRYIQENDDILKYDDGIRVASVLDGIGDAEETLHNQQAMERLGVRPLPCFHAGEDPRFLEYYIANYEYITLGGMVGGSTDQLRIWLDRIWEKYLTDGSGRPRLKVHGFGITSKPLMERYPWHSCDSSSWIQAASYGGVIDPDYGPIMVSSKSPQRHEDGQHALTFSYPEREFMMKRFKSQGFDYERISEVYESRAAYCLWSFRVVNEQLNAKETGIFKSDIIELF